MLLARQANCRDVLNGVDHAREKKSLLPPSLPLACFMGCEVFALSLDSFFSQASALCLCEARAIPILFVLQPSFARAIDRAKLSLKISARASAVRCLTNFFGEDLVGQSFEHPTGRCNTSHPLQSSSAGGHCSVPSFCHHRGTRASYKLVVAMSPRVYDEAFQL